MKTIMRGLQWHPGLCHWCAKNEVPPGVKRCDACKQKWNAQQNRWKGKKRAPLPQDPLAVIYEVESGELYEKVEGVTNATEAMVKALEQSDAQQLSDLIRARPRPRGRWTYLATAVVIAAVETKRGTGAI